MRCLMIDELQATDMEKLAEHLAEVLEASSLPDVFWLGLPDDLLTPEQTAHKQECAPHRVAVTLEEEALKIELLVRGHGKMRCSCFEYASGQQRDFLLRFMDRLIKDLELST